MILFAAGDAFRTGTHKAMILEYLKLKNMSDIKVYYYGNTRSCSQFGSAISSLIAAALVFMTNNYRYIFIGSVIPYIIELFLMLSYPKELDGEIIPVDSKNLIDKIWKRTKNTLIDFVNIFKNFRVLKVMLSSSLFDAYFKAIKDYIQPLIKSFVISAPILLYMAEEKRISLLIGFIYFILYLLTSISSRKSGNIVERIKSLILSVNLTFLTGGIFILLIGVFCIIF